jgi:tetratricopeptide (TPR) repeat protein
MRLLAWMLILCVSIVTHAQDLSSEIQGASGTKIFETASENFSQGKFQTTVEDLEKIEKESAHNNQILGLVHYWKGICYNRMQEFSKAALSFEKAISLSYSPQDIHYEYGQAFFAMDNLVEARVQFVRSVKRKFKRGVSLYYIGFISKEMGDHNKAHTFLRSISKLEEAEAKDVKQAAEMQIGDIYLEQVEKRADAFKAVETSVIPQYKKAQAIDIDSALAPIISEKIIKLQRKYDLVLFQLRNGRPTLIPPYFLRAAQEFGLDTNVTYSPAETTISKSKQQSTYSKTDFFGRYTFYVDNFLSIAPEFRFNNTYYFNRVPQIFTNDNMLIAPAVRAAYEHTLWKKPASFLLDYDYNEARRDVQAKKRLEFNSRSHIFMMGERFQFFNSGESVLRFRYRLLESYLSQSDSKMMSLVFEHYMPVGSNTILIYSSLDRMRVQNNAFDTNAITFRGDFIFARVRDWFTPSIGLSLTSTDPINNRSARGQELLVNPNLRISKTFKKSWRTNLRYDYQKNNSKDRENFAFQKRIYAIELEYLF